MYCRKLHTAITSDALDRGLCSYGFEEEWGRKDKIRLEIAETPS